MLMSAITKIYLASGRGKAPAESAVLVLMLAGVPCLYFHVNNYKPGTGIVTGPVLCVGFCCKVKNRLLGPVSQQLVTALNTMVIMKYILVLVYIRAV